MSYLNENDLFTLSRDLTKIRLEYESWCATYFDELSAEEKTIVILTLKSIAGAARVTASCLETREVR